MSVFEKFLDKMRLNVDDDFYNEEYEYEEEPEEEKPAKSSRKGSARASREERASYSNADRKSMPKITPISKSRKQGQQTGMEVCVIKPESMEDELEIAETLLNGRTVVINMEGLSVDIAQRIIDFSSGATYALHGNLQKISNYIFLATPSGVDISGDIQNLMEAFDIPGFKI